MRVCRVSVVTAIQSHPIRLSPPWFLTTQFMSQFKRIAKLDISMSAKSVQALLLRFDLQFATDLWSVKISYAHLIFKYTACLPNTLTTESAYCRVLTWGLRAVVVCSVWEYEIPQTTGLSPAVQGNPSKVFCEWMKWLGKHTSMVNRGPAQCTMRQSLWLDKQAEVRTVHHTDTLMGPSQHWLHTFISQKYRS